MTIRLFDTIEQREYQRELETYDARAQEASKGSAPWPLDLVYPKPPAPMVDSRDPGLAYSASYLTSPGAATVNSDLRPTDPADFDGTSQSEVDGFESKWNCNESADATPFKLTKG